ncbi:hypothetical protein SYNPS1DRAFT_28358 [Syncephalis pseudoplumigaleata]|uniref:Uncharacterized protein n=1 Tax=Syncephalis pseudoplumigaleata TaxID=1712513 RepID=A0A4P9Z0E5_9FUNG|nr:hypothetical protein SYNPS1DRAFT_28358 [Syncephalis pseudoplumigaleata]|eukprot:RKP25927.1 hypothetical protein SYNPS1DRAFT_28358 [Syncephalis pseudoplumigaleata]
MLKHQHSTDGKERTIRELERIRLARRHSWPLLGYPLVLMLVAAWWSATSLDAKLRSLVNAAAFSVIEFTFYAMTVEMPNGDILLRPFDPRCRKGHTTVHQFICNVIYTPILLDVYVDAVPYWPLRVLLFPLNIWLLELVQGYVLIYLHGYNPAWTYYGKDAYFHGNIKLSYWPFWIALGGAVELAYPVEVASTQWAARLIF